MRVLSLNTVFYSPFDTEPVDPPANTTNTTTTTTSPTVRRRHRDRAWRAGAGPSDPAGQFGLLAADLSTCLANPSLQPVVVGHIAPSLSTFGATANWLDNYTAPFWATLRPFQQSGRPLHLVFGHQHEAAFRLWSDPAAAAPPPLGTPGAFLPLWLAPALSPIYRSNPAFRVLYFDSATAGLADFQDYFVSVAGAGAAAWDSEFVASETFPMLALSAGINVSTVTQWTRALVGPADAVQPGLLQTYCTLEKASATDWTDAGASCCASCPQQRACLFTATSVPVYQKCMHPIQS